MCGYTLIPFTGVHVFFLLLVFPAQAREYVLPALVCVSVCVCLSVTTITKKIMGGFVSNFMRRFLGEKGRPSLCFLTISRGMWK